MRKLAVPFVVLICLFAAQSAVAAIPNVFGTLTCTVQGSGQRFCGPGLGSTTLSFDGTPIDVSVAFPPVPASGPDGNYPVVGLFHGYGNQKIVPSSATAQRWLNQGYAVFAIQDRGFFASCGVLVPIKPPSCANGYIHLLHNAYEVRDAQYLLGKLADQGVIDPQKIGATGGSYGGGMSAQLGALKDRTQLPDGSTIAWTSPGPAHIPMRIAATAPEFPWTDLAQSLMPNGSNLDYVADSPYLGPLGDHRFGIQKQKWNTDLYNGGAAAGFYAAAALNDPTANVTNWKGLNDTGGPYDGAPLAIQQINELPNHGAYGTNMDQPPAPALLSNGWNDDLFPVDETVRYYNKVRSVYPNAAIKLFDLDFGHNPRAATPAAADAAKLVAAENAWFNYYIRGIGSEPAGARGGVDAITSACPAATAGTQYTASNWASLAPGEIRLASPDPQTIHAPGTAPANAFIAGTICTTQAGADNASAATYKVGAAPAGGYTILGSSTVIAEISTVAANDAVIARLYDVAPGGATEQLIGRALYRPMDVGAGFTKQIFQLHPQGWKVLAGHDVKLELLAQDPTYARTSTGQHDVQVRNLELRIPTADVPGSAGGLVTDPDPKYLPPGYTLARDVKTRPGAPHITAGDNPNATGEFTLAWDLSGPAGSLQYALQHRDADDGGWSDVHTSLPANSFEFTSGSPEGAGTWRYRANAHDLDGTKPTAYSEESGGIKVDKSAPLAATVAADRVPDYAGDNGWYKNTVDVSFTDHGDPLLPDGSDGSGVDVGSLPETATHSTSGSFTDSTTVKDAVGNESGPASLTVQVDATDPNLSVACPSAVLLHASGYSVVTSASDGESGLDTDPSGTDAIDTSAVGPQTFERTAVDNVGHSVTDSCTTQVQYMFSGVLQPINPDGSSIFKLGSTIPVKFALTDADVAALCTSTATLSIAKVSNSIEGTFVEATSTSNATTGSLFRCSDSQHIFNLSTKGLSTGTWSLKITLDDGTSYTTHISLR